MNSDLKTSNRILGLIVTAVIVVGLAYMWLSSIFPQPNYQMDLNQETPTQPTAPAVIQALFTCPSGQSIAADFIGQDIVKLNLSDGRQFNLPRTISADGGRYANADESFVFWNKGNSAFIQENNKTTFENCEQSISQ